LRLNVSGWHSHRWLGSAAHYIYAATVPAVPAAAAAAEAWRLLLVRQKREVLPLQALQQLHCRLVARTASWAWQ
jgi:hypothetical protein